MSQSKVKISYNVIAHRDWGWLEMNTEGQVILWRAKNLKKQVVGCGVALELFRAEFLAARAVARSEVDKDAEIARLKKELEETEQTLSRLKIEMRQRVEDAISFESGIQKGKRTYRPTQQIILARDGRVPAVEAEEVKERVSELKQERNIRIFEDVEAQRAARRGVHAGLLTGDEVHGGAKRGDEADRQSGIVDAAGTSSPGGGRDPGIVVSQGV